MVFQTLDRIFYNVDGFLLVVQPSKDEERLISDLFGNYTPAARPALKDNDTVTVMFGLTLSQIIDVVSNLLINILICNSIFIYYY